MPISYQAALRLYAKEKGHFVIPKKGSADYEAIKKLQEGTEMGPEHAVKKRSKKVKGNVSESDVEDSKPRQTAGRTWKRMGGEMKLEGGCIEL